MLGEIFATVLATILVTVLATDISETSTVISTVAKCGMEFAMLLPTVAHPGFPVRGSTWWRGGADSRGSYVSKILYVETDPWGGGRAPGTAP